MIPNIVDKELYLLYLMILPMTICYFYRATRMRRCTSVRSSVCLSVCHTPVMRLHGYISSIFFTILVFPHQTEWQYSGGVECKGV